MNFGNFDVVGVAVEGADVEVTVDDVGAALDIGWETAETTLAVFAVKLVCTC